MHADPIEKELESYRPPPMREEARESAPLVNAVLMLVSRMDRFMDREERPAVTHARIHRADLAWLAGIAAVVSGAMFGGLWLALVQKPVSELRPEPVGVVHELRVGAR